MEDLKKITIRGCIKKCDDARTIWTHSLEDVKDIMEYLNKTLAEKVSRADSLKEKKSSILQCFYHLGEKIKK